MSDIYDIPGDYGHPWRLKKFVEYQHEVPSIHYRVLAEYMKGKGYTKDDIVMYSWYMSCTYNEITCMLLGELINWRTFTHSDYEALWNMHKATLNFGSARKYAKNMDWFVPLMDSWMAVTKGEPYKWVKESEDKDPETTYRNIKNKLSKLPFVGRFACDLFFEQILACKDELELNIKEPAAIDWENCANLTSGIFNIFYEDEKANEYDKTRKLEESDKEYLTGKLLVIQKAIQRTYPEQESDINKFIGKICSFRNLFKNARYAGFHHDREQEVIRQYELDYPEYQYLWDESYAIRKRIFSHRFLGELNGWTGIRKERKKMFLSKGLTGAELDPEAPDSMPEILANRLELSTMKANIQLFYDFCQNSKKAHDIDPALSYMREVVKEQHYTLEEIVWWCFLYAVTYDLAGSFVLLHELPHPAALERFDPVKWRHWWGEYESLVPYQKDKIKQRVHLIDTIASYKTLTEGHQYRYLEKVLNTGGKGNSQANFDRLWFALKSVSYFGRFSIWNFLQALHEVALMDIEPPTLMIGEPDAVALTDGLAFAFGLTDLVTKKVTDPSTGKTKKIYHKWTDEEKDELEQACILLRADLKLDNFQLETLASSFMKLFRSNDSRYVGYHNDRLADELRTTGKEWKIDTWDDLWKAREKVVPAEYLHQNAGVNKDWMKLPADKKIYL